jgi:hypothetical protein
MALFSCQTFVKFPGAAAVTTIACEPLVTDYLRRVDQNMIYDDLLVIESKHISSSSYHRRGLLPSFSVVMSLRTYALYGRNMPLLICLLVLLGCQIGAMGAAVHSGRRECRALA